jgi:hypothetical protein
MVIARHNPFAATQRVWTDLSSYHPERQSAAAYDITRLELSSAQRAVRNDQWLASARRSLPKLRSSRGEGARTAISRQGASSRLTQWPFLNTAIFVIG